MDNAARATIQDRTEIEKGASQVEVRDVHVPVFMRLERLNKTTAFMRRLGIPAPQQPRLAQDPISAGWADRYDVAIQHHESQPAIAFEWILPMELNDSLLFPSFQPVMPGNQPVVFIGFTVALFPVVELTAA